MLTYIVRRFLYMIISLWIMSIVAFIVINLPPGDFLTRYIAELQAQGGSADAEEITVALRKEYGLDQPGYVRYFKWMSKLLRGDFGMSFTWKTPVIELVQQRLILTITISLFTFILTYAVAIPIGIYSATHQYSVGDYTFTTIGFVGLATPNFLLALILMFIFFTYFDIGVGGLFSPEYVDASWSLAKIVDMLYHLWIPIVVIGTAGTAALIRVMRACLLDELSKQYVITARAKGVKERVLLFKYPVRMAINPIVSTIGWQIPGIISGETITAIVLALPTIGPLLLESLRRQDMFLAGAMIMLLSFLTIIGTFLSDLLLTLVDPRIRYD